MKIFDQYADYYNVFYKDKNYQEEAIYVDRLIKKYSGVVPVEMLNIGCGSGNHDIFFSEMGYKIDGFDLSQKMIQQAQKLNLINAVYTVNDIESFKTSKKYDCIVSLFHVLSYQISNREVNKMFEIVSKNLKPGGVFIFDCWYGPAVLRDLPSVRLREFQTDQEKITRIAVPEIYYQKDYVDVNYKLIIKNNNTNLAREIAETHSMRYFFIPELESYCENNCLQILFFNEWLTNNEPTEMDWNICFGGKLKEKL